MTPSSTDPRRLSPAWKTLGPDLFLFSTDSCNVYILRTGNRAVAVDFGTGKWLDHLDEIGVAHLDHVVLTHIHRDQCCGLYRGMELSGNPAGFAVHVPALDAHLTTADGLSEFWRRYQSAGCPSSYAAPRAPVPGALPDMSTDTERMVGAARFCAISTPGHTPGALSYIVSWSGRQLAFCGDAAHSGGRLHQPYHLEWDHWTPSGALAAWYGLERLAACRIDLLLPSHGSVVGNRPRECVRRTQRRLIDLVRAKSAIAAGEPNRWLDLEDLQSGARRVLPHLYAFGGNGYLLVGNNGEGLVIDPTTSDMPGLELLLKEIDIDTLSLATATHYHVDHADALNLVRQHHGARIALHPWVAEPLRNRNVYDVPWLPPDSVQADRLLPEDGHFRWGGYRIGVRPFPGQTWWHCAFDTQVDGRHVLLSGDNFQPPTRWNGTGGFCAFNGSRFAEGFSRSASTAIDIDADIVCNGHRIAYEFARSHYRRILSWSSRAETAVRELCPSTVWLDDYDPRSVRWEPFVNPAARAGTSVNLAVVYDNRGSGERQLEVGPQATSDIVVTPARRRARVPAGSSRRFSFTVRIGRSAPPGRHLVAADVTVDGRLSAEACVALVDVTS